MEDSDGNIGNSVEADGTENEDQEESVENIKAKQTENKTSTFDFTEKSWRTDFVLIVEGTKLYVAKNILSLASPVFDTMFQSDFKQSSCDELELPGKKLNDVIEFLRCIYPNTFTQITRDNATEILPLIEEYQVLQLKPKCEDVLLESINEKTAVKELFLLLRTACLYDLQKLRQRCIDFLSASPEDILDESYRESFPLAGALQEVLINVNKTMKARLGQLEDIAKEHELFKQYMSAEARRSEELKLDAGMNWSERIVLLTKAVNKQCIDNEKEVIIWDVPLKINAKIVSSKLNVVIENTGEAIFCYMKVRCILVNRQPNGFNHVVNSEERFQWQQTIEIKIRDTFSFVDVKNGFMQNGTVGIIVQLYMSEPNRK